MMKNLSGVMVVGFFFIFLLSPLLFAKNYKDTIYVYNVTQSKTATVKSEKRVETGKKALKDLTLILSPFENITEFALKNDEKGIKNALRKIKEEPIKTAFKRSLSPENYKILNSKINEIEALFLEKKYNEVALASTEIFEFIISNFEERNKIENQINLEYLDYMGFRILALLNQNKIDWDNIELVIFQVQKKWNTLSSNIKDKNLKDAFDYLFEGLHIAAKNKDVSIMKIFANMVLSLVDVLERSI